MNHNEFQDWVNTHKNAKAPYSAEVLIMDLSKPKGLGFFIKPMILTLTSIVLLFTLSINLTDYFYIMAQGTPFEGIVNTLRVHDKWISNQYNSGQFIDLNEEFENIAGVDSFFVDADTVVLRYLGGRYKFPENEATVSVEGNRWQGSTFQSSEEHLEDGHYYVYYRFENEIVESDVITISFKDIDFTHTVNAEDIQTTSFNLNRSIRSKSNSLMIQSMTIGRAFTTIEYSVPEDNEYELITLNAYLILENGEKVYSNVTHGNENRFVKRFNFGTIDSSKIKSFEIEYISWIHKDNLELTFDTLTKKFDKKNDVIAFDRVEASALIFKYEPITEMDPINAINAISDTFISTGFNAHTNELLVFIPNIEKYSLESFGTISFSSQIPDLSDFVNISLPIDY